MKKVAVILSGCGFLDGAEIRESVLTLLALDLEDVKSDIFAPDVEQFHVVNHLEGAPVEGISRNVLQEAARIARGDISTLDSLSVDDYDGLVIPGGFGVAKNLSSFAFKGADGEVISLVSQAIEAFYSNNKPVAAVCIAPSVVAMTLGNKKPTLTIGQDAATASEIEKTGAIHKECETQDCVVDVENLLVSTPAYMDGSAQLKDVFSGITKMVQAFVHLAK